MSRRESFESAADLIRAMQSEGHVILQQGESLECPRCGETWQIHKSVRGELRLSDRIGSCS